MNLNVGEILPWKTIVIHRPGFRTRQYSAQGFEWWIGLDADSDEENPSFRADDDQFVAERRCQKYCGASVGSVQADFGSDQNLELINKLEAEYLLEAKRNQRISARKPRPGPWAAGVLANGNLHHPVGEWQRDGFEETQI